MVEYIVWFIIKLYAALGIGFLVFSWVYDNNYQNSAEEEAEDEAIIAEMTAWPWYKIYAEMAFMYLIAFLFWPRFAFEIYQESQSQKV